MASDDWKIDSSQVVGGKIQTQQSQNQNLSLHASF